MKKLTLLFTTILISLSAFAQKATIKGTVLEIVDGTEQPIPFANVTVLTTDGSQVAGGNTDFDGNYNISLDGGSYRVEASFIGYTTKSNELTLTAGENKELNFTLSEGIEIDVVEIDYKKSNEGEGQKQTIELQAKSTGIVNVEGAEAMSKKGVSNVSDAASKVTGVSKVGNKNVFVRGMGDRYNAAYLNGLPMPSPDPDLKVVPLNLFPTSVVKNIGVNKTFSADNYGDYAGGAITINTKDFPGEFIASVQTGVSMNSQSTFKDFTTYEGGANDMFGFDDGTRDLPTSIPTNDVYNSLQAEGGTVPFKNNLNPVFMKTPVNTSLSLQVGDYKMLGKESNAKMGYLITANHGNGYNYSFGKMRTINKQEDIKLDYDFERWNYTTNSSVLANLHFSPKKEHNFTYNYLLINTSNDETRDTRGFHFDYPRELFSRRYTYRQNTLMINQLRGEHELPSIAGNYLEFNWAGSFSTASSTEPDRKQLIYLYDEGVTQDGEYDFNAVDRIDNHRFFSWLNETEISAKAEIKLSNYTEKTLEDKDLMPSTPYNLKLGFNQKMKTRDFDYRQFIYDVNNIDQVYPNGTDINNPDAVFNDTNHGINNGYYILEVGDAASRNDITQTIMGIYALSDVDLSENFKVIAGVRYESSYQDIIYKNQQTPIITEKEIINGLDILPHLNLKYNLKEDLVMRFAGSRTISRPGFKEMAPFEYTEFFAGLKTRGNPELQNGTNNNIDLRFESYKDWGMFSVGAFGKYLQNPIERTMLATASGQLQSFQNSNAAQVAGVEIEYVAELMVDTVNVDSWKNNFNIGFNASYLYSKVVIDESASSSGGSTILTNLERPLQGASPYLINLDLGYKFKKLGADNLTKRESNLTLAYNIFGKRVFAAGIQGIGDQYELPVSTLNLTLRNKFFFNGLPKLSVNLTLRNLLNPDITIVQAGDSGESIINDYKRGIGAGFTVKYTFMGN